MTRPFVDDLDSATLGLTPPASVLIGDLVGPYRLLQQLGDGGMGSVWLAERADGSIKRKVALKLPRMVWARDLASRMARERDILGSLEHPQIARLYDAGVDQLGRPFLALEYVEGRRIDHYCDEQRFGVTQRIRLFLQVLEAVQYAHINLVLHRDLKPANVLVNQRGEIRLLDFGIAKLLDDDTVIHPADVHSRTLSRAMTPRYASPEQVQGLRLSLASDVYSLGVMLYEMLVGHPPYVTTNGSRAELEIAIVEGHLRTPSRASIDPAVAGCRQSTPSRLARTLRGELDAVLLKALARNPADRYPSAEALRTELLRWLEGHPVRAKRPSRLLAARKFVMRNALSVALCSAAVTAVCTAAFIATLHAREARIESRRAAATRDFLLSLFENANPELHGGRDVTARELLVKGEELLDKRSGMDGSVKADVYSAIADLWSRLGDSQATISATLKRKQLVERMGPSTDLLEALLDYAEASKQASDYVALQAALVDIEALEKKVSMSDQQKSEFHLYTGWLHLQMKDAVRALQSFGLANDAAIRAMDIEMRVRASSGRIQSYLAAGDRKRAREEYFSAMKTLQDVSLKEGERIRRAFEVTAPLYQLGEYSLGWPLMDSLARQSRLVFGDFSESQILLQLYWVKWSIRAGETRETLSWIRRRKEFLAAQAPGRSSDIEYYFSALEAEILVENRELVEAGQVLATLSSSEGSLSVERKKNLSLIRMEIMLLAADGAAILEELKLPIWRSEEKGLPAQRLGTYRAWYEGMALVLLGKYSQAEPVFELAQSISTEEFGVNHPTTARISFNRAVLASLLRRDSFAAPESLIPIMKKAIESLERSLPPGHRDVERAKEIIILVDGMNAPKRMPETAKDRLKFLLH
ncbi:MAG: serine/threonine protein kinase [Gammaproteobacteria bacterium]|nr:serine/threonine protein kinase [Gammaproteobacteria bacterium]